MNESEGPLLSTGIAKILRRGPSAIPTLIAIVHDYRPDSLAYFRKSAPTRTGETARRTETREAAINALGFAMLTEADAVTVVPVLEALAKDRDEAHRLRTSAVFGLGLNGTDAGLDALARLFQWSNETHDDIQLMVISMFARTPNPRGREILAQLPISEEPVAREGMETAKHLPPKYRYVPPARRGADGGWVPEVVGSGCSIGSPSFSVVAALAVLSAAKRRRHACSGPAIRHPATMEGERRK